MRWAGLVEFKGEEGAAHRSLAETLLELYSRRWNNNSKTDVKGIG
jgi:hypothetical protein